MTLTTNGVRLAELVPALKAAGVDGVNISLDAADPETFQAITGFDQLGNVLAGLDASLAAGLHTKINFVLLAGCEGRVLPVAKLAQSRPVDVRFIEVMPIGAGAESRGLAPAEARKLLLAQWPDLHPVDEHRGNGPARYDASARLLGRIGWIEAVSHAFCASCNRARVTCSSPACATARAPICGPCSAAGPVTRLWNRPWQLPSTKNPGPTALARARSRNSTSWRPLAAENRKTSRILYLWESSKQFAFPKSGACRSTPSRKPT